MARFAKRALYGLLLLAAVSLLSFVLLSLAPGDFFEELKLNPQISPQTLTALRAEYGLDRPFVVRYWCWTQAAGPGDFWFSLPYKCPVGTLLLPRAIKTLVLTD